MHDYDGHERLGSTLTHSCASAELLKYFDEEELLLTRYSEGGDNAPTIPVDMDMSVTDESDTSAVIGDSVAASSSIAGPPASVPAAVPAAVPVEMRR